MPEIIVTTREGEQQAVVFSPGASLMQSICEGGLDELLALCGGVCSCATCHVHVDEEFFDRLEPVSEDEDGLLSGSGHRRKNSRLSCQVRMTDDLDGMRVTIAPED
ncbi:MAG: 2Fe-2S iron-sulfur cluster-binding protein [Gammaproteobacteria bacterium]|jgi:2Fe-2S ferredoxin|nr:2Fe-2S iron-sulfur cluster-binding protein [Gammaproteobacteria bacterium]